MDEGHKQARETRRINEEIRRERRERERAEQAAQVAALRQIRDDPSTTPETRLEAVKMLLEMESKGYI